MHLNDIQIDPGSSLGEAIENLHFYRIGIVLIAKENTLLGVITDGDIRKAFLNGSKNTENITKHMNKSPVTIDSLDLKQAIKISCATNLDAIPVVKEGRLIGVFINHLEIFITYSENKISQKKTSHNVAALILAGGEGKRLRPYTDSIPKSLATIGNTTLLERNISLLRDAGITTIYVAVNYLAEMIENKLTDGKNFGVKLIFLKEKFKLGTAGPISLINEVDFSYLIVLNADVVCNILYSSLMTFHKNNNNDLTIVCSKNFYPINYGVISMDEGLRVTNIEEKPVKEFWCAAGIYMFNMESLQLMYKKDPEYKDMPDLIKEILSLNRKVISFPLIYEHEHWFDVATLEDLREINAEDWPKI